MPPVSPPGHQAARKRADAVAAAFNVPRIDLATLDAWRADADSRSLYVFDVRDPDEYRAGHIPGMKNVPGGQLVQETDRHAATWGARIVVVDDDGVRAIITAHWLLQMGWDAAALTVDMRTLGTEAGAWRPAVLGSSDRAVSIEPEALRVRLDAGRTVVIDLDWHRDYRAGHIPGAWYAIRSRLDTILPRFEDADLIVLTSGDGVLGELAAAEWAGRARVAALAGGTRAWKIAGMALESGQGQLATPADDTRLRAREMAGSVEDAMRAYLSWEIDLAGQMATDDDQRFRIRAHR
jgi:rhodanese-related sulfurtransferase